MAEYLAPGVYVEETSAGARSIKGVATSTVGFLGATARGALKPAPVNSPLDFLRRYGGAAGPDAYLPDAVRSFFDNGGQRCVVARVTSAAATTASATFGGITVAAAGPGASGNRIWVRIRPASAGGSGGSVGFRVEAYVWDALPAGGIFDPVAEPSRSPGPDATESLDGLSLDPASPDHWSKVIAREARLVALSVAAGATLPTAIASQALTGGDDGDPLTLIDFAGENADPALLSGLAALALEAYDEVSIVHAPAAGDDVVGAVIAHCEARRSRFAVVDAAPGLSDVEAIDPRASHATPFAAVYWPWLEVPDSDGPPEIDPASGARRLVPPGGAVCGVYARTDIERGVWQAPAGPHARLAGVVGLEFEVDENAAAALNGRGANVIRRFPDRGILVWGARTLSEDILWKYISVRRLLIYIEQSIDRGTQWAVFEPNGPMLWTAVRRLVEDFLLRTFRDGALSGAKAEDAFYVRVGAGETMPQNDIDQGHLIVEIGVAPIRPAEFVVFRTIGEAGGGTDGVEP